MTERTSETSVLENLKIIRKNIRKAAEKSGKCIEKGYELMTHFLKD